MVTCGRCPLLTSDSQTRWFKAHQLRIISCTWRNVLACSVVAGMFLSMKPLPGQLLFASGRLIDSSVNMADVQSGPPTGEGDRTSPRSARQWARRSLPATRRHGTIRFETRKRQASLHRLCGRGIGGHVWSPLRTFVLHHQLTEAIAPRHTTHQKRTEGHRPTTQETQHNQIRNTEATICPL